MYIRNIYFLVCDILNDVEIIIISRGLLPRLLLFPIPTLLCKIRNRAKKIIWDFDDDILLSKEISTKEYLFLSENANKIFITHSYLANKINYKYRHKIVIIPTTDGDFDNIKLPYVLQKREQSFNNVVKLIWTGSAVNLAHILPIINSLDYCAEQFIKHYNKRMILQICSSAPLICTTKYLQINFVQWDRLLVVRLMEESHIGIMPLLPSEYSLGKGGFKLIQYMAAGLPIIGSDVGYNKEIIQRRFGQLIKVIDNQYEWLNALMTIVDNFDSYKQIAKNSIEEWNNRYSFKRNLELWSKHLELLPK